MVSSLGVKAWLGLDCGVRVGLWLSVTLKVKLHILITVSASTLNVITMHLHNKQTVLNGKHIVIRPPNIKYD